jgi:internalin A
MLFLDLTNMKLILLLVPISLLFFGGESTLAIEQNPASIKKVKSFEQWCRQKKSLPPATRRTIDVMLSQVNTKNCRTADFKLNKLTKLEIRNYVDYVDRISDIQPFASLTKLTELSIEGQKISDLRPLSRMTNLTNLNLSGNQVSDVRALAGMTNCKCPIVYGRSRVLVVGVKSLSTVGISDGYFVPRRAA